MQSHIFLLIWTWIALIGSFTGNIKIAVVSLCTESIWGGLFLLFYMVCISSWVTPAAPLRSWVGRRTFQRQLLSSLFILVNMLNIELSRGQKFVPSSLNDTPFEKWLSTSAIFIIILLFPLVFVPFSPLFLWQTHYKWCGPVFHLSDLLGGLL